MRTFTDDNTNGYTQQELDTANRLYRIRMRDAAIEMCGSDSDIEYFESEWKSLSDQIMEQILTEIDSHR